MTALVVPATFEDIEEAIEVGIGIDVRVCERMADAGLPREMDHPGETVPGEQRRDLGPIRKIGMNELESGLRPQQIEPRLLERGIVKVVEIVEPDDMTAFGQQLARDMKADETRGTRNQYGLFRHPIPDTGVPIPKFVSFRGIFLCKLRNRRTLANY